MTLIGLRDLWREKDQLLSFLRTLTNLKHYLDYIKRAVYKTSDRKRKGCMAFE